MSEENIYTFENEQYRKTYWHTCSHILAQAVKRLRPQHRQRLLLRSGRTLCLYPRQPDGDRGGDAEDLQGEAEAGAL